MPQIKWTANLGTGQLGAPVLSDEGVLLIPGNVDTKLYALDKKGQRSWTFDAKDTVVASPVVDRNGLLYFGDKSGMFYALDSAGSVRWKTSLSGGVTHSATIGEDGTLYVVGDDRRLYALGPQGSVKWQQDLRGRPGNTPALADDGTIYVVAGAFLTAFRPGGSLVWQHAYEGMGELRGLAIYGSEMVVLTSYHASRVMAVQPSSGSALWTFSYYAAYGSPSLPAVAKDGTIYFTTYLGGHLYALSSSTGKERYSYTLRGGELRKPPVLDDSTHVYIVNDNVGMITLTAKAKLRWSMPDVLGCFTPAFGPDGTIYVTGNKQVYAVGQQSPYPDRLEILSGNDQSACSGSLLQQPLRVRIRDQYDAPFANQLVEFRVVSGGGSLSASTVSTGSAGMAEVRWRLGPSATAQQVEARAVYQRSPVDGSPVTFTAIAIPSEIAGVDSVNFGRVSVGKVTSAEARIWSTGNCALEIDSLRVTGSEAAAFEPDYGQPSATLTAGEDTVIRLRFTALHAGIHTAKLLVYYAGPAPLAILLRGDGECTLPQIQLVPPLAHNREVALGDTDTTSFAIRNLGCDTLLISQLGSSSPVFQIHATSLPFAIPPQAARNLTVFFAPRAVMEYSTSIRVASNDPSHPESTLLLDGRGVLPWSANLDPVDFGSVCIGSRASFALQVCNRSNGTLRAGATLEGSGPFSIASGAAVIVPPHECRSVQLDFAPTATGTATDRLALRWLGEPQLAPATLSLQGQGAQARLVGPNAMRFGILPVGSRSRVDSSLQNLGDCALSITAMQVRGPDSAAFTPDRRSLPLTIAGGQLATLGVTFAPQHAGASRAELELSNELGERVARVALVADGSAPALALANSLTFPPSSSCASTASRLAVHNTGDGTLTVSALTISGDQAADFSLAGPKLPATVPPHDSLMLDLKFTPSAPDWRTARLVVESNDPDLPRTEVALRGYANSQPDIKLSAHAVNFDSVVVGRSQVLSLTIFNRCGAPLRLAPFKISNPAFSATVAALDIDRFDSLAVPLSFRPAQSINYDAALIIDSNDPDESSLTVRLHGIGIAPDIDVIAGGQTLRLATERGEKSLQQGKRGTAPSGLTVGFSTACVADTIIQPIIVYNRGTADLTVFSLRTASKFFWMEPAGERRLKPGAQMPARLFFLPDAPRDFIDSLKIWSDDPDENPFIVPLLGKGVLPSLAARKDSLSFAEVAAGTAAQGWVNVQNLSHQCDLQVSAVRIDSDDDLAAAAFRVSGPTAFTLSPDSAQSIRVAFSPTATRAYSARLEVFYNDGRDRFSYPLNGTGARRQPKMYASTNALKFGTIPVGISKIDSSLYLRNDGSDTLRVAALDLTNSSFHLAKPFVPIVLAPGRRSASIAVMFFPTAAGRQDGELQVRTNDPHLPQYDVEMDGAGDRTDPGPPNLCISPARVTFDRVALGDSAIRLVSVTNCGDATVDLTSITGTLGDFRVTQETAKLLPQENFVLTVVFKPIAVGAREGALVLHSTAGSSSATDTLRVSGEGFALGPQKVVVHPNPFTPNGDGVNEQAIFDFSAFNLVHPTLKIFTLTGRLIRRLEDQAAAGRRQFLWDGRDDDGRIPGPGVFIYLIEEGGRKVESGHVALIR